MGDDRDATCDPLRETAPTLAWGSAGDSPSLVGRTLGPYVIESLLGEGGMGSVWLARRSDGAYEGRVAIKLVRAGLDSRSVMARFDAERQVLALLNHPNIARVLDAGTAPDGRPWFVMEYVEGLPLTDYCESRRLSVEERLDLFLDVCAGVQHAHQKGIIHRDLKPSNLLVAEVDGKPVPKVIDFGIAKATGEALGASGTATGGGRQVTVLGEIVGTPAYMSPEQWAGATPAGRPESPGSPSVPNSSGVDTRTDIYALGVVLFEMLVGKLPQEPLVQTPQGSVPLGRPIGDDAPRPTARFAALGEERGKIAAARRTDPAGLAKQLSGDLNWIVMKAIEQEPDRRYETVAAMAGDIRAHRRDEPVSAGPPSLGYRARKFVRRHRWGVAASLVAGLALVAGIAIAGVGLARALSSERLAAMERDRATAINDFLLDTFSSADPFAGSGRDTTIVQALDAAVKRLDTAFTEVPETQAAVLQVIGATYAQLGREKDAEPLLKRAADIRRGLGPGAGADLAQSLNDLACVIPDGPRTAEKLQLMNEALEIRRTLAPDGSDAVAETLSNLAFSAAGAGDQARAKQLYLEVIEMRTRLLGPESESTLRSKASLAQVLRREGDLAAAAELLQSIVEIQGRTLPEGDIRRPLAMTNLARVLLEKGDLEQAEDLTRKSLAIREKALGPDHTDTLDTASTLAQIVRRRGRPQEAADLFRRSIEGNLRSHASPVFRANYLSGLGGALKDLGDLKGAFAAYEESAAIFRAEQGPDHPNLASGLLNLGVLKYQTGDYRGAEPLERESLRIRLLAQGPDSPDVANAKEALASTLGKLGKLDEAIVLASEALASFEKSGGPAAGRTLRCRVNRAGLFFANGRKDEAEQEFLAAYRASSEGPPELQSTARLAAAGLARLYGEAGRNDEAARFHALAEGP